MINSHALSRSRPLANALTWVLGLYGAWGWLTDPMLPIVDRLGSAAVAFLVQHLANMTAAFAAIAAARGQRVCAVGATLLTLVFSGVSGHSIEHTMNRPSAAREAAAQTARDDERARLLSELHAATAERARAQAALLTIPSDIPTRRIQALQAPLNEAMSRSDARIATLEAARAALDTPIEPNVSSTMAARSIMFWLLAFAEPGLYWLLIALGGGAAAVPPVPSGRPVRDNQDRGTVGAGRPSASRRLFRRIAVAIGLTAAPAAYAADAGDTPSLVTPAQDRAGTARDGTNESAAPANAARAGSDTTLVAAILELNRRGISIRRIAATLGVRTKSTVHRILQRERAATQRRAPPRRS